MKVSLISNTDYFSRFELGLTSLKKGYCVWMVEGSVIVAYYENRLLLYFFRFGHEGSLSDRVDTEVLKYNSNTK